MNITVQDCDPSQMMIKDAKTRVMQVATGQHPVPTAQKVKYSKFRTSDSQLPRFDSEMSTCLTGSDTLMLAYFSQTARHL